MNKRGQFYLIAAILIIIIVAAMIGVKTYVSANPKPRTVQSMSSELKEEGFRVVDYGIYNNENITKLLSNFTDMYAPYFTKKTNNANVIFVYGNKSDLFSAKYETASTGKISANIGGNVAGAWNMESGIVNRTRINVAGNKVNVTIFNKTYIFDLKENNEMFYFVIVQEKEGEVYVEKS